MPQFRVLGPIGAVVDGHEAELGGPRQRRLLAALLVRRNTVASEDALVEAVFAGAPSPRAAATLRSYVTRLRRSLGTDVGDRLRREGLGYRLDAADHEVDSARFESLLGQGRRELGIGDAGAAVATLRAALDLWHGDAYEEFAEESWAQPDVRRLEAARLVAFEHLVDAELACDRAPEMVAELQRLVAREPYRDGLRARLMLALYRSGRQAEALVAYDEHRTVLEEELGLDPGPDLVDLHRRILHHDPVLQLSQPAGRPLRGYRLGERLGTGSRGTVFAARLPDVPRDFAIRIYPAEIADAAEFVRTFEADARRLASVDHDAVVRVHDAWREPGSAVLVMARMGGGSLQDRLAHRDMAREDAATILGRVGSALVAAARRGVVHPGVGADSVLFDRAGNAHLGDFRLGGVPATVEGRDSSSFLALATTAWPDLPVPPATLLDGAPSPMARLEAVVNWVLGQVAATQRLDVGNPYVGLRSFQEEDAANFFGRSRLVDEVVTRVTEPRVDNRLVLVVGGSGSGKSSLVRAGLLPRLRAQPSAFVPTLMTPGARPFKELDRAIERVAVSAGTELAAMPATIPATGPGNPLVAAAGELVDRHARLVVVVDQMEELFTMVGEVERDRFLDMVVEAVTAPDVPVVVVATLRADHFHQPLAHRGLGPLVAAATVPVTPLAVDELEEAIAAPARGLDVDRGLVAELVGAAQGHSGLPALQFTLWQLVEEHGRLHRDDLASLGGLEGAVATRAERLFSDADAQQQAAVRRLFEGLVVISDDGYQVTSRRRLRADLAADAAAATAAAAAGPATGSGPVLPGASAPAGSVPAGPTDGVAWAAAWGRLVETWVQARLLVSDRDPHSRLPTIELAHEALLDAWPRLREWVEQDRDWLRLRRQLEQATATWQDVDEDPGGLLRGPLLDRAVEASRQRAVPADIGRLVAASTAQRELEVQRARADERRRVATTARLRRQRWFLVAALVVAMGVGAIAVDRQQAATRSAAAADARARAATTGLVAASDEALASDWPLALLLATEARSIDDSALTRRGLLTALTNPRPLPTAIATSDTGYQVVAITGQGVVAKHVDGTVDVLDGVTGEVVGTPFSAPILERVNGMAVSEDLVAASGLPTDGVGVVVHDLVTGEQVATLPAEPDETVEVAFSHDGQLLAVTGEGRVRLVDVATWEARTLTTADGEYVLSVAFSSDDQQVVAGGVDGTMWSWDVDADVDGNEPAPPALSVALPLTPGQSPLVAVAPMPDSDAWAVATFDAGVYLVSAAGFRILEGPLVHDNAVTGMAVSPDGQRLAVAAFNRLVTWTLAGSPRPEREHTIVADATDVAFDDGGQVVTVGLAGEVTRWDLDPVSPLVEPVADAAPGIPAVSPDGQVLAMRGGGAGVRLFDLATRQQVGSAVIEDPESASIAGLAFTPDSSRVVVTWCPDTPPTFAEPCPGQVAVYDGTVGGDALVAAATGDLAPWVPWAAAASPDGRLVAIGLIGGTVELRDVRTLEVVATMDDLVTGGANFVTSLGFSSDDAGLLVATTGDNVVVWDVVSVPPQVVAEAGPTGITATFTPDDLVVTSAQDGTVALRDPSTLQVVEEVGGLNLPITGPTFATSGTLMATSDDFTGAVRLWDTRGLVQLGGPFAGGGGHLDPSGAGLVIGGDPVTYLTLDPDRWSDAACEVAGRNLTSEEWDRYVGDGPRRATCPDHPLP